MFSRLGVQSLLLTLAVFLVFFGRISLRHACRAFGKPATATIDSTYDMIAWRLRSSHSMGSECEVTFTYQPESAASPVSDNDYVGLSACSGLRPGDSAAVHYLDLGPLRRWASLDEDFGQKGGKTFEFVIAAAAILLMGWR